jgi:hypothetical protein
MNIMTPFKKIEKNFNKNCVVVVGGGGGGAL